jgi:hypothetical protein
MECPYCREEVKQGASKCKNCGEFLQLRNRLVRSLSGLLTILVPFLSLLIAGWQVYEKDVAIGKKEQAQDDARQAQQEARLTTEILSEIPREIVRETALSEGSEPVGRDRPGHPMIDLPRRPRADEPGYREIQEGDYSAAEREFKERIQMDPRDENAQKGLIYLRLLRN